jgi:hypothetical protein
MGKDKFKQINKMEELLYSCPKFLCDIGIFKVSESGIFQNYGKKYSKCYEMNIQYELFSEQEFASVLRTYDIQYRVTFNIQSEKQFIIVWLESDNFHIAYQEFGKIEEYMNNSLSSLGLLLKPMKLQERMRLVNQVFRIGMEHQDMNVMDYVHSVSEWKEDFELKEFDFLSNPYIFSVNSRYFTMFYIERCNLKYIEKIEKQFSDNNKCLLICKDFAPAKDEDIRASIQNNYMGLGNIISKLKRENPELYRIYNEDGKEDSRGFVFAGATYLYEISGDISEELKKIKDIFFDKQGEIKFFSYQMNQALAIISPTGNDHLIQYRMYRSKDYGKLINLKVKEKMKESHEKELEDLASEKLPLAEIFV